MTYAIKEYDKETGLYYLNSRMYDPVTARFLQEDTYTGDPNDPLSLNLYTYCANEPIMYTDPKGHARGDWWDFNYFGENASAVWDFITSSDEEKQEALDMIEASDDTDFGTLTTKLFINPTKQLSNANQAIKSFITDNLGIKEGSVVYNVAKYVGTGVEALGANGINLIKGTVQMGNTVGKPIGNALALGYNYIQYKTGNITEDDFNSWYDSWSPTAQADNKALFSLPANIVKGVADSSVGLVNNGLNFFNPNATLEQKTQAVGDFYNVVFAADAIKTTIPVVKSFVSGFGDAFGATVRAGMEESSVRTINTGVGVTEPMPSNINFASASSTLGKAVLKGVKQGLKQATGYTRPNNQVEIYKEYTGLDPKGQVHHGLPEQFHDWYIDHGITNINAGEYYFDLPKGIHKLKAENGIHTNNSPLGNNWNAIWREWIRQNPEATPAEINAKLNEMARGANIEQYRAKPNGGGNIR